MTGAPGARVARFARQRGKQHIDLGEAAGGDENAVEQRPQLRGERVFADRPPDDVLAGLQRRAVAAGGEAELAMRDERQPEDLRSDKLERRAVARLETGAAMADEEDAKARRAIEAGRRPGAFGERRLERRRNQLGAMRIGFRTLPARRRLDQRLPLGR